MSKQRACGAIAMALIAVVPAGCGSSKSDNAPTKAEFLKKGNAICKNDGKEIEVKGKKIFGGGSKPTPAQMQTFAKSVLVPEINKEIDSISAITPPKGDEAKVKAILDSARADVKKGAADPKLLLSDKSFKATDRMSDAYGLRACGSDG